MKVGGIAENLMERVALFANLAPQPLLETQIAFTTARARSWSYRVRSIAPARSRRARDKAIA